MSYKVWRVILVSIFISQSLLTPSWVRAEDDYGGGDGYGDYDGGYDGGYDGWYDGDGYEPVGDNEVDYGQQDYGYDAAADQAAQGGTPDYGDDNGTFADTGGQGGDQPAPPPPAGDQFAANGADAAAGPNAVDINKIENGFAGHNDNNGTAMADGTAAGVAGDVNNGPADGVTNGAIAGDNGAGAAQTGQGDGQKSGGKDVIIENSVIAGPGYYGYGPWWPLWGATFGIPLGVPYYGGYYPVPQTGGYYGGYPSGSRPQFAYPRAAASGENGANGANGGNTGQVGAATGPRGGKQPLVYQDAMSARPVRMPYVVDDRPPVRGGFYVGFSLGGSFTLDAINHLEGPSVRLPNSRFFDLEARLGFDRHIGKFYIGIEMFESNRFGFNYGGGYHGRGASGFQFSYGGGAKLKIGISFSPYGRVALYGIGGFRAGLGNAQYGVEDASGIHSGLGTEFAVGAIAGLGFKVGMGNHIDYFVEVTYERVVLDRFNSLYQSIAQGTDVQLLAIRGMRNVMSISSGIDIKF